MALFTHTHTHVCIHTHKYILYICVTTHTSRTNWQHKQEKAQNSEKGTSDLYREWQDKGDALIGKVSVHVVA